LPAISTIERLCADALVAAERRIETRIAQRLNTDESARLNGLLTEMFDGNISRFIWLRKFEVGNNSAAANASAIVTKCLSVHSPPAVRMPSSTAHSFWMGQAVAAVAPVQQLDQPR